MMRMITTLEQVSTRLGVKPKEAKRFVKFLIVGAIGFVVDFGFFNLLLGPINAKNKAGLTIQTTRREEAKNYILNGLGNQLPAAKGTWWAAVNGIVEWIEKTRDSESALIGTGANKKRSALLHAVALSQ